MMMFQLSFYPSKEGYGNHRCKSQLDRGILEVYPQDKKQKKYIQKIELILLLVLVYPILAVVFIVYKFRLLDIEK